MNQVFSHYSSTLFEHRYGYVPEEDWTDAGFITGDPDLAFIDAFFMGFRGAGGGWSGPRLGRIISDIPTGGTLEEALWETTELGYEVLTWGRPLSPTETPATTGVDSVVDHLQPIDPAVLVGGGGPAPVKKPAGLEGIPEDKIIAKKFDKEGNLIRVVYTNEDGEIVKKKIEPVTSGTGSGKKTTGLKAGGESIDTSKAKEVKQFKLEKGWLGEEAAMLNRETRQLDRETSVLTRKKKELEKDKEFLQGHREYLEDKLEKQENEVQKARENLDNTREAYERRIKEHESETDKDRARQARREVVERYKEEYGEDWTESEANKDGDLTRQASEDVAKEMERLNNEWKEEGERLGQEAENAVEEAERDVRRAERGADNTKRNLGKTNEMAEENSKELKDTESRLKENQRAEDRNRRRQERLRRQERARQVREEARRQRAEERRRAEEEDKRPPEWSGQRRATNQELQAAVKRAEMKVKAMKVFQAMYTWDGEKRIKPASGYEGSTDFSAKVDNSGKLLDMATNVLTEGLKKGFAGEASPAGDVAGTVRDSLDAIGETYNTMSQAFTTESAMGAGRFEGAYRNMTSFDDATKKTGVSFNNARERELVSRMVFQMGR